MKIKPIFTILLFTITAFFFVACGGVGEPGGAGSGASNGFKRQASQEEVKRALGNVNNPADKETSVLGKRVAATKGDIIYGIPENYPQGSATLVITLTPYEQGFKLFFHPLLVNDPQHVCSFGYVVQNGRVLSINKIADNRAQYVNENTNYNYYKGYVESGVFDNCADYDKDTVWVINGGYINGFDPLAPYTFILRGIASVYYDDLAKIDISINDKTDNTKVDLKYLGKKLGDVVTKPAYRRAYPSKEFAFNATITPYEKGFKVKALVPRTNSRMCFGDSDVYQDGTRYEIGIIGDSWYEYFADDSAYPDGYVESGFFNACAKLPVDTTYVVEASRVGFNPKKPYTVKLGRVNIDPVTKERQAFDIKPQQ